MIDDTSALLPWLVPVGVGLLLGHPLARTYAHWQRMADPDRQDSPRERRWRARAEALAVVVAVAGGVESAEVAGLPLSLGAFLGCIGGIGGRWAWPAIEADIWPAVVAFLRRRLGADDRRVIDEKNDP